MTGQSWAARYSDGRSAASRAATAQLDDTGLTILEVNGPPRTKWRLEDIRLIEKPAPAGDIRLGRAESNERLTLLDRTALPVLQQHCRHLRRGVYGGIGWKRVAFWSGAALAGLAFLFLVGIPFLARHSSQWMSPRLEADLGRRVATAVIRITADPKPGEGRECTAPEGRAALAKLAAPLIAQLHVRNQPRLRVVNSPIVNAVALPGGQILLFRGLIDFAQGPNEIAGVIAHELGHVALDHPTTVMVERGATAFLIGLVVGDVFGVSAIGAVGTAALSASYSREAESAADAEAVALMEKAGYDLAPFAAFFTRLEAKQGDGEPPIAFLRSHPKSAERARLIAAAQAGGRQALQDRGWTALKAICGRANAASDSEK
ncbi:MAG: M48 family metallopeptidase [Stellaceae bacterium]